MAQHLGKAEFPYDELRRVNFERKKDPLLLNLACSISISRAQRITASHLDRQSMPFICKFLVSENEQ